MPTVLVSKAFNSELGLLLEFALESLLGLPLQAQGQNENAPEGKEISEVGLEGLYSFQVEMKQIYHAPRLTHHVGLQTYLCWKPCKPLRYRK